MRKLMFIAFGVALLFSISSANAQKEKFHSLFIYNFSKYIKWPENAPSDKFVIGVLGSSQMVKTLEATSANKKINGADIVVRQFNSAEDIQDCHILYVSQNESNKIGQVSSSTGKNPVLIVTDKPGMAQKGAAINFIEQDGKIRFELNQSDAESRGLKVSGALISLAVLV